MERKETISRALDECPASCSKKTFRDFEISLQTCNFHEQFDWAISFIILQLNSVTATANFSLQILVYEKHEITKLQTRWNGISIKLNGNKQQNKGENLHVDELEY